MKTKILIFIALFVQFSCSNDVKIKDSINYDEDVRVLNNIYLIKHPDEKTGNILVKKESENIYQTIIEENIYTLIKDSSKIFATTLTNTKDTNYYILSLKNKEFLKIKMSKTEFNKEINLCKTPYAYKLK